MMSFQDAPDKNIEHDEKMELRSRGGRKSLKELSNKPIKSDFKR